MSEIIHYKGTLIYLEKLIGESLEEQCKRLCGNISLSQFYNTYEEYLLDSRYMELVIIKGDIYEVKKNENINEKSVFSSKTDGNGDIEFEIRYNEGIYSFEEAIEKAVKNIN